MPLRSRRVTNPSSTTADWSPSEDSDDLALEDCTAERGLDVSQEIVADADDEAEELPAVDPAEEARAEEFERGVQAEAKEQFKRLKDEAQAIYGLTRGRVGARTPQEWAALLEKAGDEIGNGQFLVRWLGAERYLEPGIVAVLVTLRQNLMAELKRVTAVDVMTIDTAIVGYYNFLRAQRWIGDLSLVVERELFGEEPLNVYHGDRIGDKLKEQLGHLAEVLLPLQDRAARMMQRSLEALRSAPRAGARGSKVRRQKKRLLASTE